jgi:hypothetical protein
MSVGRGALAVLAVAFAAGVAKGQTASPDSVVGTPADTSAVRAAAPPAAAGGTPDTLQTVGPSSDAPTDTTLGGFLRGLADSTDVFFGPSSAPVDTAGLDSVLAFRLAHPDPMRDMRRDRASWAPWLSFNRADGPVYGAALTLGHAAGLGALSGRAAYAAGPNDWLGGGILRKQWIGSRRSRSAGIRRRRPEETAWTLEVSAGRFTSLLDPERSVSWQRVVRALVNGSDRHHYYRRDGVQAMLERETPRWRASVAFRDHLESPLATTATWNLIRSTPSIVENFPAASGRVLEADLEATARLPRVPFQAELGYRRASDAWGSDFDYQRLHLAAGGDVALGRFATLVPQAQYGRLGGDVVPQAAFYLGGTHSLRSMETNVLAGAGKAFGRVDLIFTPDLPARVRLPVPGFVVVQGGLFAASGAVWGVDPYGGPSREGDWWPAAPVWLSEVGVSLLYRPGLPEPRGFLRLDYARGVGSNPESKFTLHYTVPLDLLRRLE